MAKFDEEMKKFIVKAFGRNNSPTKVRLDSSTIMRSRIEENVQNSTFTTSLG